MTAPKSPARDAIHLGQEKALRRLLVAVARSNAFYRRKLCDWPADYRAITVSEFLDRMPFTRKTELVEDQLRHPPYGTNLTYPLSEYARFNQTSGTSGQPMRWLDTPESWQWMLDNWKAVFAAAGVEQSDHVYFAFSFGPFLGFWTAFEAASQMGCLAIPGGGLSSVARLIAMRDNRATVLCCTPTYALRLAEVAAEEGMNLSEFSLRTIIVAGEPGGSRPAVRSLIHDCWPTAQVFDHHGMTEVGPVTYQCPEKPGTLMVLENSYLAEILDPDGEAPVTPGDIGELVLTTLGRLGSPLIRYRTGDLVREDLEVAAKYGRHELALDGGILDRVDDMLLIRGVNVFPAAVEEVVRSFDGVAEYRIEVAQPGALADLRIEVEPIRADLEQQTLAARIETKLRATFNLRVAVTSCTPGTLPRFEMKARRWVG